MPILSIDLTSMNPQEHFDPDFDVVDDMKFIDSLIRTIPEDHQSHQHHGNEVALASSYHSGSSKKYSFLFFFFCKKNWKNFFFVISVRLLDQLQTIM